VLQLFIPFYELAHVLNHFGVVVEIGMACFRAIQIIAVYLVLLYKVQFVDFFTL